MNDTDRDAADPISPPPIVSIQRISTSQAILSPPLNSASTSQSAIDSASSPEFVPPSTGHSAGIPPPRVVPTHSFQLPIPQPFTPPPTDYHPPSTYTSAPDGLKNHGLSQQDGIEDPFRLVPEIQPHRGFGEADPLSIGDSPTMSASNALHLSTILAPGTDMSQSPPTSEARPPRSPQSYQLSTQDQLIAEVDPSVIDEVEEIIRAEETSQEVMQLHHSSTCPSKQLPSLACSEMPSGPMNDHTSLWVEQKLAPNAQEMGLRRFHHSTCGILSVKNGYSENPWQSIIMRLAMDSPALMNAILSMAAFHSSHESHDMKVAGIYYMRESAKELINNLDQMPIEIRLATTISLAFADGWDQHTITGIPHLSAATSLIKMAAPRYRNQNYPPQGRAVMRFLCHVWIYQDVISRLIELEEREVPEYEYIMESFNSPPDSPTETLVEVDPLLGCAKALFPIIARAAALIRKVRMAPSTDPIPLSVISQATEITEQLRQWRAPYSHEIEPPEDKNSLVSHIVQNAEAYRSATLLYLHEAVPEIPSQSTSTLSKEILSLLATVPIKSPAVIVQIFPLLAASCAAKGKDRDWVEERWRGMSSRLNIGNVDKCPEVIRICWNRRDEYESKKLQKLLKRERHASGPQYRHEMDFALGNSVLGRRASTIDSFEETETMPFLNSEGFDLASENRPATSGVRPTSRSFTVSSPVETFRILPEASNSLGQSTEAPILRRSIDREVLEPEYTVRGRLHWAAVMRELEWEGRSDISGSFLNLTFAITLTCIQSLWANEEGSR